MNEQRPFWEPASSPQAGTATLPRWYPPMTPTAYDAPPPRRPSWWQRNRADVAGAALGLAVTGLVGGFVLGNAPTPPQPGLTGQVSTQLAPSGHQNFSGHSSGDGEGRGSDVADAS